MNTIKIKDPVKKAIKVGQFYRGDVTGDVYQVVEQRAGFALCNLNTGKLDDFYQTIQSCIASGSYTLITSPFEVVPE